MGLCELNEGEVLYLPAGSWFHEVTTKSRDEKQLVHAALNFWF